MSRPKIEKRLGMYVFTWVEEQVVINVARIREHRDGHTTCQLTVRLLPPYEGSGHLYQAQFNLSAARARLDLAKMLNARYNAPWPEMLEQFCVYSLELFREGEPIIEIRSVKHPIPPPFLVKPLLYENQPNVIFGDPGTGKGYLALLVACCAQIPWKDNPFGFEVKNEPQKALVLDWETEEADHIYRLSLLTNGLGLEEQVILYRHCARSFMEEIEEIHQKIADAGITLLIVDSLGPACGDDLNPSAPPIAFFNALRRLRVTSFIIAHTSKGEGGKKTIYGSTFFTALARSVWEIRTAQEPGSSEMQIALFHRKSNPGKIQKPLGFHFSFFEDGLIINRTDIAEIPEFAEQLPVRMRLEQSLRGGSLTIKELGDELGIKQDTIRKTLNRFRQRFTRVGDKWGLLTRHEKEVPEVYK